MFGRNFVCFFFCFIWSTHLETCVSVILSIVLLFVAIASAAGDATPINGCEKDQIGCQEEYAQHQGDAQCRFVGQEEAQHGTTCRGCCHRVVVVVSARFRRHDVGIHQSPVAPCEKQFVR